MKACKTGAQAQLQRLQVMTPGGSHATAVLPANTFPYIKSTSRSDNSYYIITNLTLGSFACINFHNHNPSYLSECLIFNSDHSNAREVTLMAPIQQTTGAQEWHILSLLDDVTSPTSAVHYVSMTSDLRVLSTEKRSPVRRQHTMYTNKSLQCKGEVHSSPLNK